MLMSYELQTHKESLPVIHSVTRLVILWDSLILLSATKNSVRLLYIDVKYLSLNMEYYIFA